MDGLGVEDLIEKPVKGRRGPATVSASESAIRHWGEALGRRRRAMTWSQENCPIDGRRLTRERWGRGFWRHEYGERFSLWFFSSVGKHCSYISFILCWGVCPGPGVPRPPSSFFARVAFVGRFSPWFQLYGEALLIHFYLRRFCGGPPKWILEASFFS